MNELIIGTRISGHDGGIFILNPTKQQVYGIAIERLTRIKHDKTPIIPLIKKLNLKDKIFSVARPFTNKDILFNIPFAYEIHKLNNFLKNEDYSKFQRYSKTKKLTTILTKLPLKGIVPILRILFLRLFFKLSKKEKKQKYIDKFLKSEISRNIKIEDMNHHLCHAASAYYFSPFKNSEKVLCLTLDGVGDNDEYSKLFLCENKKLKLLALSKGDKIKNYKFISSIGWLYIFFTQAIGLMPNSDEGKVEALACYSKNQRNFLYKKLMSVFYIDKNLSIKTKKEAYKYFNIKYLKKLAKQMNKYDFCAAIQLFLEDFILMYVKKIIKKYNIKKFCFAGGIFANVKLNMRLFEESGLEEMYIFPAMGDDGSAVGAAILKAIDLGYDVSWLKNLQMPYFGDEFSEKEILRELNKKEYQNKISFKKIKNWEKKAAELITKDNIISVYKGKMEFGPRALGNRSVLANPMNKETRDRINSTIKRRPWFQPFCPSILEEDRKKFFEKSYSNKHMTCAFKLKPKYFKKFPSAGHIDGTARPQFVTQKDNLHFYRILKHFKKLTGFGILVNTSFNLHGRAIVMTPTHALQDFIDCGLDYMFMEGYIVKRKKLKC